MIVDLTAREVWVGYWFLREEPGINNHDSLTWIRGSRPAAARRNDDEIDCNSLSSRE
jgi:hypothetical protein